MKIRLLTALFLFLLGNAFAQLSGTLSASSGEPIAFANVLLMHAADSSFAKGAVSDDTGKYTVENVQPGRYLLRFSAVGYQTAHSGVVTIAAGQQLSLGAHVMNNEASELGEVLIRGEKPLFSQEIDRTVVHVESSVLTKGSSALQVLERSPGVIVDMRNSSISLNGKGSLLVMINGRVIRMPVAQIVAMLSNMTANDIEKIELITTPPARYDADGAGGMINIVLKKTQETGTSGSLSATAGQGWGEKAAASISLSRRTDRLTVFGSYAYLRDKLRDGFSVTSTQDMPSFGGELDVAVTSTQTAASNSHNALAGIDLRNGKSIVGGTVSYNQSRTIRNIRNEGSYRQVRTDSLLSILTSTGGRGKWDNVNANIYFEKQFRAGEKLNADFDFMKHYYNNPTEGISTYTDRNAQPASPDGSIFSDRQKGISRTPIQVSVGKLDYVRQLTPKFRFEAGGKVTFTRSSSLSQIAQLTDGQWTTSARYTNSVEMREKIFAAYISAAGQLNPSLSISGGLRYEYSQTRSDAAKDENDVNRKVGKLFPSVFLSKKLGERSEMQFSYTKRISRPSFNDLSSYLLYTDPMSVSTGNPSLRPTITNNLKVGYQLNGMGFSLTAGRDDYPIILYQLKESPARDLMYLAPQNMRFQNNVVFQANIPVTLKSWWTMSYGLTGSWRQFQLEHTWEQLRKSYVAASLTGSQTFTIPNLFAVEISGWYNSGQYEGSKRIDAFGMLNAGVKRDLKNNLGSFQFTITDLFKSMRVNGHFGVLTREAFDIESEFLYRAESARKRIFKLTYTRTLGNAKLKSQAPRSSVSKEERDRIR